MGKKNEQYGHPAHAFHGKVAFTRSGQLKRPATPIADSQSCPGPTHRTLPCRNCEAHFERATVTGTQPLDPATLRQNVTSPGGTTAAALDVLMAKDGLEPLLRRAIIAATERSRALAG